jgi:hypothetical protein
MPVSASPTTIPNPLIGREPEIAGRLAILYDRVLTILFDRLAAGILNDLDRSEDDCLHSFEDVRAVFLTLRVLTKPSWDATDLRLLDTCWRTASRSDLLADEFEAERHRIQHLIEAARAVLSPRRPITAALF